MQVTTNRRAVRRRRLWTGIFAIAACLSAHGRPGDVTPQEYQALSPVCQAAWGTQGSPAERLRPYAHLIAGFCGITHTCGGELATLRYQRLMAIPILHSDPKARARLERDRRFQLQKAISGYSYEIRCAAPSYPLLPKILTGRGNARSLGGDTAGAMEDFQRALSLDPAYAPAQVGLAAARARAAGQAPSHR